MASVVEAGCETDLRRSLREHDFPDIVLDAWESEGITKLLPIQRLALQLDVFNQKACLVIGPTTCGKTFIGEMVCVKHALEHRRCLYLVPFKALAEEKYCEFRRKYARPEIGATILISTADRRDQDRRLGEADFNIAILTYEKLSALLVLHPGLLKDTGAVVVDEIQMVADDGRGAELELLLTRIRQVAPDVQIVGLSAAVSELNGFDDWLEATVIRDDHRPVSLREGVYTPDGKFTFREWVESARTPGTEQLWRISGLNEEELAASLVAKLLEDSQQQVIVFANSVDGTQKLARAIADRCDALGAAQATIKKLATLEASECIEVQVQCLQSSVAFHNADLTLQERQAVESGFRSRQIRCIVSTSTLSMGVNLPASTVIIAKPTKWNREAREWQLISVADYRNMSGRAGRFGLLTDPFGRSILIAKSPLDQRGFLQRYVEGTPESLESAFLKRPIAFSLLRVFASGLCDNAKGAERFLLKTFAARQAWNTEESKLQLTAEIEQAVTELTEHSLVAATNGKLRVTEVGLICAASGLEIETFGKLMEFVQTGNTSELDIARLAALGDDTGPNGGGYIRLSTEEFHGRTPHFVAAIRDWCANILGKVTESIVEFFDGGQSPTYEQAKELKYQSAAMTYVSGVASREIENRFGVGAARARSIGAMCSWLCETAAKTAWVTGRAEQATAYEILAERFAEGCSEKALFLCRVRHSLHRAEREQLVEAGYTTFQKIIDTDATEIAKVAHVARARVQTLQRAVVELLGESLELERQQLTRLKTLGLDVAPVESLYTAQGTALEQAIQDVLVPPFCTLHVSRISRQRRGEADLKLILSNGRNGIAQVHAKESADGLVALVKAGAVLQQSPELKPEVFICFGRPEFEKDAILKAAAHVASGKNYKLIPVSVLAEMFVRFHEKRMDADRVVQILEQETGHITLSRL